MAQIQTVVRIEWFTVFSSLSIFDCPMKPIQSNRSRTTVKWHWKYGCIRIKRWITVFFSILWEFEHFPFSISPLFDLVLDHILCPIRNNIPSEEISCKSFHHAASSWPTVPFKSWVFFPAIFFGSNSKPFDSFNLDLMLQKKKSDFPVVFPLKNFIFSSHIQCDQKIHDQ